MTICSSTPFFIFTKGTNQTAYYLESGTIHTEIADLARRTDYLEIDLSAIEMSFSIDLLFLDKNINIDIKNNKFDKIYIKNAICINTRYNNICFIGQNFLANFLFLNRVYKNIIIDKLPNHYLKLNKNYINRKNVKDVSIQKNTFKKRKDYTVWFKYLNSNENENINFHSSKEEAEYFRDYFKITNKENLIKSCLEY